MTRPTKPTSAPHGTLTRYTAGCSCFECCEAKNAYQLEYLHDGRPRRVDVEPVRARLHELYRQGWSRGTIATAIGVHVGVLRLADGTSAASQGRDSRRVTTRIRRETADAIMSFDGSLPGNYSGLLPAGPYRRIAERMIARFGMNDAAKRMGVSRQWLLMLTAPPGHPARTTQIRARNALKVRDAAVAARVVCPKPDQMVTLDARRIDELAGESIGAMLDAAGITLDTWDQIRSGRPVPHERAERIIIALGLTGHDVDRIVAA